MLARVYMYNIMCIHFPTLISYTFPSRISFVCFLPTYLIFKALLLQLEQIYR